MADVLDLARRLRGDLPPPATHACVLGAPKRALAMARETWDAIRRQREDAGKPCPGNPDLMFMLPVYFAPGIPLGSVVKIGDWPDENDGDDPRGVA